MPQETLSFDQPIEIPLEGTPDMIRPIAMRVAEELKVESYRFELQQIRYRGGLPALALRAEGSGGGGSIGILFLEALPRNRALLRVPTKRGSDAPNAWSPDNDGALFTEYLRSLYYELSKLGYVQQPQQKPPLGFKVPEKQD
jgi:hypothetical protein